MKKLLSKNFLNKGFSLSEALVYVAVLAILVSGILAFALWMSNLSIKAKSMREVYNTVAKATEVMAREIKEADKVYAPTTTASQLSLKTEKYLSAGEEASYIDFYICGTKLCFKKEGLAPIAITPEKVKITNITFTKIVTGENVSVQISIQAEYDNPDNRSAYQAALTLVSSASLRSY